jgi:hypothetical protein
MSYYPPCTPKADQGQAGWVRSKEGQQMRGACPFCYFRLGRVARERSTAPATITWMPKFGLIPQLMLENLRNFKVATLDILPILEYNSKRTLKNKVLLQNKNFIS